MTTYYISGPMSGIADLNFPAFERCAKLMRRRGGCVFSPHEKGGEGESGEKAWEKYLRADIEVMMKCNAIVLLDGWPKPRGAKLELSLALGLGFKVFYWKNDKLVPA